MAFAVALVVMTAVREAAADDAPTLQHASLEYLGKNKQGYEEYRHRKSGIALVLLPPGTFSMGSPESDRDRVYDETLHEVELTKPFLLGKTEVTIEQFREFRPNQKVGRYARSTAEEANYDRPGHPIINISWNDAKAYCDWAGLRLPTEAEWEYAARGGDDRRFPWGDRFPPRKKWANLGDVATAKLFGIKPTKGPNGKMQRGYLKGYNDKHPTTSPVDAFPQNPYGLHGLAGNALELCADWHADYLEAPAVDPKGPSTGERRIVRGGDFRSWQAAYLRCAARRGMTPTTRWTSLGFRVAMDLP